MARTDSGCALTGPGEPTVGPTTPGTTTTPGPTTTLDPSNPNLQRTVVYFKLVTSSGQDVFVLGGIDHDQRAGQRF